MGNSEFAMKTEMRPLEEVRIKGFEALVEALGPVDAVRFLGQYDLGSGDYTRDRFKIIGEKSAHQIFKEMRAKKKGETESE